MRNIKEFMNESTRYEYIAEYIYKWGMEQMDKDSMATYIVNIIDGMDLAIKERNKYFKEDDEKEATEYLEMFAKLMRKEFNKQ
jgi:hypothetical protein